MTGIGDQGKRVGRESGDQLDDENGNADPDRSREGPGMAACR